MQEEGDVKPDLGGGKARKGSTCQEAASHGEVGGVDLDWQVRLLRAAAARSSAMTDGERGGWRRPRDPSWWRTDMLGARLAARGGRDIFCYSICEVLNMATELLI
jgi:hypothetical protein